MALVKRDEEILFDPRKDMRAHGRTRVYLHGKLFNPKDDREDACLVLDLSPNGAGLKSACTAGIGSRVVLHADELGRFEGAIVRRNRLYVGVQFKYSETARERIVGRIANYLEHGMIVYAPTRDSGRFAVASLTHRFALKSGEIHLCEIVDIALSGISVKTNARPAVGQRLFFGKTAALVVRHTDVGFAVAFSYPNVAVQRA